MEENTLSKLIIDDKYKTKYIEKLEHLIQEFDDQLVEYSTDESEEIHHKDCKFECCGGHSDYFDDKNIKCPKCGMTEFEQDDHNDDVWSAIDDVEGGEECSKLRRHMENFNKAIVYLGGKEHFHH